ncbi:unnamed protein product [Schistocephalus solidus]|uniref:N-terminal Ras-GEF domain-containing protein n=1 Tax=Schistocephalus solidus TaxID=70667 RepID=A0A183T675_SCHSO|nr:unnamed protein product [Schistocephalus solidus]
MNTSAICQFTEHMCMYNFMGELCASGILAGCLDVADPDGTIRELTSGDSLGVRPSPETQYHRGQMITVTEDCQFVCVAQADYVEIMARVEGQAEIPEVGEGGRVVLVYENTDTSSLSQAHLPTGTKTTTVAAAATATGARVVVKGTPEKLIEHLMADMSPADSNYPEDFLLTYRTFLDSPLPITSRLLQWYHSDRSLRSRVKRYVLLWVHNHFNDFDDRPAMLHFLNKFDDLLVKDGTGKRSMSSFTLNPRAHFLLPSASECVI